jgi:hypothetical protein
MHPAGIRRRSLLGGGSLSPFALTIIGLIGISDHLAWQTAKPLEI